MTKNNNPKIIGITGGIGSGKTVATDALRNAGYFIIDADEVSRELFSRGSPYEKLILSAFPIADDGGVLNRRLLRKIIAEDKAERQKLDALTHPIIVGEISERLKTATPPVILSAPLLFESGLDKLCDTTVCIYCPFTVQVERVKNRDGIDGRAALDIVMAQMSNLERIKLSDYRIRSDVPIEEFEAGVLELIDGIVKK